MGTLVHARHPHNDAIAHPIRLRIVGALLGRALTTEELAALLPSVPQTTLYRHVARLLRARVIRTIRKTWRRGGCERLLSLTPGAEKLDEGELRSATRSDHERYVSVYCAMLMAGFQDMFRDRRIDASENRWACIGETIEIEDEQFMQLYEEVRALFERYRREPARSRSVARRKVAFLGFPERNIDR